MKPFQRRTQTTYGPQPVHEIATRCS